MKNYTKIGLVLDCGEIIELVYKPSDEQDIMKAIRDDIGGKDCFFIPENYGGEATYNGIVLSHINVNKIVGINNY